MHASLQKSHVDAGCKPYNTLAQNHQPENSTPEFNGVHHDDSFKLMFYNNPIPMFLYDIETLSFLEVNDATIRHYGYSRDEFLNMTIKEIRPIEDMPFLFQHLYNDYSNHRKIAGARHQKKDGSIIDVELTIQDIEFKGRPARFVLANDTTAHKQAQEALRKSEGRYRTLIEQASDGIFIADQHANLVDVNTNGCTMLGYTREELLQLNVIDLLTVEDLATNPPQWDELKMGKTIVRERELKTKEGKNLEVEVSAQILPDGNFLGIVRDITERNRIQKELARAQRLETAGRVAGQIAHDFNNLLSPLSAYPTLIREELPSDHKILEFLEEIERATSRIVEINQQLLALGRRGHYTMETIELNSLLQNALMSLNLPGKITIRQIFASNLLLINGGPAQLSRVLINLITNAVEAMEGAGSLTFKTENIYLDAPLRGYKTINRGEYVRLEITDTGPGIPPEILDKIFDPFFTTKKMDRTRGSGLGLSVVHGVVQDHKGYVTVASVADKGTTFSLYFPVSRKLKKEQCEKIKKTKGGTENILIVDDDPIQLRVLSEVSKHLGYHVHTVSSGEQAIRYLKSHPKDLVLLDMVMDGIDGAETYRRILQYNPNQRAIVLSGFAMSERVKEALQLGAHAFLPKPVSIESLATAVRKSLDKKRR